MTPTAASDARMIDAEHQIQIQLLNELRRDLREGGSGHELRERLADYCRAHFLSEELLMRLHAYPGYDDHVADHEQLIDALEGLTAPEQADALSALLLRHIGERDATLHAYLDRV